MKRCPQCNRLHSDMADKCSYCGISLSGGTNSANSSGTADQQPLNSYQRPKDSYQQLNISNEQKISSGSTSASGKMGFGEAISSCFKKYVNPNGRARRSEYWYFALFYEIVIFAASFIDGMLGTTVLYSVAMLAMLCPQWCVMVRRLHDVGQKWTFCFWGCVPFYGWYKIIAVLVKDSDPGSNMYGPCPK